MTATFAIATFPTGSGPTVVVSASPSVVVPITLGQSTCYGYITAGDIIRRALLHILSQGAETTLEADEYSDGLAILNSFMEGLESDGIKLGYRRVCNISDVVNIPNGAIRGVAANLAIDLAPMFGGKVTAALIAQAQEGMKTLYKLGVKVGASVLPSHFPNSSVWYQWDDLYTRTPYGAMTMAGNRRITDLGTASVAEKIGGFWTVQDFHLFAPDVGGRITNNGKGGTYDLYAEFNLTASTSTNGGVIGIARNNAVEMYVEDLSLSTTPISALVQGRLAWETGDFIDIVVADTVSANEITVIDCLVRLS